MATLAELKRDLVSNHAAIAARKANGIPFKDQQAKAGALVTQIMAMETAERRMAALLRAVGKAK